MGTPCTELLREVVEDDARTARAQRLATTLSWCAMGLVGVVLMTVLIAAAMLHGAVGWVPVAGDGGLCGLLAAVRWLVVRRRTRASNAVSPVHARERAQRARSTSC